MNENENYSINGNLNENIIQTDSSDIQHQKNNESPSLNQNDGSSKRKLL